MAKYELIPEQLLYEGTIQRDQLFTPTLLPEEDILRVHDATYWYRLKNLELTRTEIRRTGFPLSAALVERERIIAQGTITAAYVALHYGIGMNVAGGTHHAFTDRGEGFCLLNDQAIAAAHLLAHGLVSKVLIVDLDVHQGNGTAQIFSDDARVFTFSMHGAANYPLRKERSDLDVPLADATDDATYLGLLREVLPHLLEQEQPDFVFYQSGVDILASDKLGRLGVSPQGCRDRDRVVLQACKTRQIPVQVSMGGGYTPQLATVVEAHAHTFRIAEELYF
ncbi:Acetoin utilization deacetylase AcuC [Catalinimonas alkaloidigena]|uniref:Acetoin utilization deacetylase AcuC n=1 Tax=Catalinimonas alkaloidigena TaxID=1075417 RepID=A0A1G9BH03_9BACT|nr:histone deacetylase [Catalinimonas alkaloidigena]SDK38781.1 Acetoin utilization deacetylase AcuC [Catalinimonas alkaloidigena]